MSQSSAEATSAYANGRQQLAAGDLKSALSNFLVALALAPHERAHRTAALNILGLATGYRTLPPAVLAALRDCVSDPTLDVQPLSLVMKTLAEADARLAELDVALARPAQDAEQYLARGHADWLLADPLLHGVLARGIVIGLRLENVLTAVRAHALRAMELKSNTLLNTHRGLLTAMALQMQAMRFPWLEGADETAAHARLPASADALLVRAMYRPLAAFSDHDAAALPPALHGASATRTELARIAATLPNLTPIEAGTSTLVRDQYERYPYPPWDGLSDVTPTTFPAFVNARFGGRVAAGTDRPEILSAGCGTGRGALMLALTFPAARVTAVDLSAASLAYALLKAEQLAARNISFGVADILRVSALGRSFDVIESSGVLHHMADPGAGLQALASVLKPGGLMRVALYSERARGAVIAARQIIADHRIPDADDGVRTARRVLAGLPLGHAARGVVDTPEFFTVDGLHDLIFNVQESRFTPAQIKRLLRDAGLAFLGFDLADARALAGYRVAHPGDPDGLDLDKWESFEHNTPGVFAEMYQFWCHKPAV
ncbi:MAG: class I SAM-dependent methyltransferase [Rhodospirillaceae bacterium]|nr:class I SAM-dependent methyltransferase [Rhodospirillaceae bacterium]